MLRPQSMSPPAADLWPGEWPSREQAEEQLACLLASESFSGAQRSREFLRLIVGEALAGRRDRVGGRDGPHMALYRAGTLARLGRAEEARREVRVPRRSPTNSICGTSWVSSETRKRPESCWTASSQSDSIPRRCQSLSGRWHSRGRRWAPYGRRHCATRTCPSVLRSRSAPPF